MFYYIILSVALNHMNDTRNAEKAYRKSIELNPDNPEALINLIILEVNQGKIKEAEKNFHSFQEACLSCSAIDKEVRLIIHSIKKIYLQYYHLDFRYLK